MFLEDRGGGYVRVSDALSWILRESTHGVLLLVFCLPTSFVPWATSLSCFASCAVQKVNFRYSDRWLRQRRSHTRERHMDQHRERHASNSFSFRSSNTRLAKPLFSSSRLLSNGDRGTSIRCSASCHHSRGGARVGLVNNSLYDPFDVFRVLWRLWLALVTLSVTCAAVGARYGTREAGSQAVLYMIFGTVLAAMVEWRFRAAVTSAELLTSPGRSVSASVSSSASWACPRPKFAQRSSVP